MTNIKDPVASVSIQNPPKNNLIKVLLMILMNYNYKRIKNIFFVIIIGQLLSLPALVFAWLVSNDDCATRGGQRNVPVTRATASQARRSLLAVETREFAAGCQQWENFRRSSRSPTSSLDWRRECLFASSPSFSTRTWNSAQHGAGDLHRQSFAAGGSDEGGRKIIRHGWQSASPSRSFK